MATVTELRRTIPVDGFVDGNLKHFPVEIKETATMKEVKSCIAQAFHIPENSIKNIVWVCGCIEANDDEIFMSKVKEVYCRVRPSLDPSTITPAMALRDHSPFIVFTESLL